MAIELQADNIELQKSKPRQGDGALPTITMPAASYPVLSNAKATLLVLTMSLAMVLNVQTVQGVTVSLEAIGEQLDMKIVNYQVSFWWFE